jgi:predicted MFS family arabinose efflux permease
MDGFASNGGARRGGEDMQQGSFWRYENRLIAVLTVMFGFVFFDRNAMTNLSTFVAADLHLNNTEIGLLASVLSFAWAISGVVVGALSDSFGHRKTLLLTAVVIFSVCSVISGLAPSLGVLLASRLLMGFAEGPIMPISQALVVLESPDARRGLNMGVMQNLGSNFIGSFLAPVVLVTLAQMFSWRSAFFIAAVPGLICAALIWKWVHEPRTHEVSVAKAEASPAEGRWIGEVFRHRNMWLCIVISCFMVPWMTLGWTFLPTLYVNFRHFSPSDMKWLVGVLGISAAVFAFIVPGLSDRFGRKPVMVVFTLIGVLYPFAALYFSGSLFVLALLVFVGWSASGTFPLFMATIPSESIPARFLGTSLGLVMGIGELIGSPVPTLAGKAADRFGLPAPMFIAAGCAVIAAALTLFLRETAPVKVGTESLARVERAAASG